MEKVTYLLGAGASAMKIPVLNSLNSDIENLAKVKLKNITSRMSVLDLNHDLKPYAEETGIKPNELIERYCNDLIDLAQKIESAGIFNTIDAYANSLIHSRNSSYINELKSLLSSYLHLKQFLDYEENGIKIDKRYTDFFLSIREPGGRINKNINIVSWNYDVQLEYCYSLAFGYEFSEVYDYLSYYDKRNFRINHSDLFKIFKINGSSKIYSHSPMTNNLDKRDYYLINPDKTINQNYLLNYLYKVYLSMKSHSSFKNNIFFSRDYGWDRQTISNNEYLNNVRSNTIDTKKLVIIGYSFHPFNQVVDLYLLENYNNLDTIIVQDFDPDKVIDTIKMFDLPNLSNVKFQAINISKEPYRGFHIPSILNR